MNMNITTEANTKAQAIDKMKAHALAGFAPRGIPANAAGNVQASGTTLPGLIEPGLPDYDDQVADSGDEKAQCDCESGTKKKKTAFKVAVLAGMAVTYIGCCALAAHAAHGQIVRAEARAVEIGDLSPILARGAEAEVTESVCTNSSSTTYPTPSAPIGAATINGAVASAQNMTVTSTGVSTTDTGMTTASSDMTTTGKDTVTSSDLTATTEGMTTTNNGMVTETKNTVITVATQTTTAELSCAATPAITTITVTLTPTTGSQSAGSDTVVSETSTTTATTTVTAGGGSASSSTTQGSSSTGASPANLTTRTSTSTTTRYITISGPATATANTTATTIASADAIMGTGTAGTIGTILATGTGAINGNNPGGSNSSLTYMMPTPSPTSSTFPTLPSASTIIVSSDASSTAPGGGLLKRVTRDDCAFLFGRTLANALGGTRCAVLIAAVAWGFVLRG